MQAADFWQVFRLPVDVGTLVVILVGVGAAIGAGALAVFLYTRFEAARKRATHKVDVYGVVIDETDGSLYVQKFTRIEDRIYMAVDTAQPYILIVPSNTRMYRCLQGRKWVPCFLAYARGMLMLPLDGRVTSALSAILSTDDLLRFSNEDTITAMRRIYDLEEKKTGHVLLSSPVLLTIAFDIKRAIREMINSYIGSASDAVAHLFKSSRILKEMGELVQSMTRLETARKAWLPYIAMIVLVVVIAVIMIVLTIPQAQHMFGR